MSSSRLFGSAVSAVLVAVSAVSATGCGVIMHGSRQDIMVQSSPAGAKLETNPVSGSYTTPTTLNLERKNSYTLTFTSAGYTPATFNIQNKLGVGTVIADVLLTGLVGVVVDGITGAWYALSPESATVTLTKATDGPGPDTIHVEIAGSATSGEVGIKTDAPGVTVRVEKKSK